MSKESIRKGREEWLCKPLVDVTTPHRQKDLNNQMIAKLKLIANLGTLQSSIGHCNLYVNLLTKGGI